jgi:nucleoside-diphosphate-sugar epimerase
LIEADAVVTGGAGFIGYHVCTVLLDRGLSVACLDNLSTGSRENAEDLCGRKDFTFLECDVTQDLREEIRARFVYHLASPASVPGYLSRPIETLLVNSVGTLQMLHVAERCGASFLFSSTSEVYGDPLVHPQTESYWGNVNPVGIRACYDESKRFGEAATVEFVRSGKVDARVVRIFNTYGPRSRPDDGRIIPNFVIQALRGDPITVYGDGSQTRSFCYVDDLTRGIVAAMESPDTTGQVLNLGNPCELTVLEVAQIVTSRLGSGGKIVYLPLPEDDPVRRKPDITLAREQLSWEPTVSLDEGIDLTAEWFRRLPILSAAG